MSDCFIAPIAVIIYNRPNQTRRLFEVLEKIKPNVLFIIADGPKDHSESDQINETRCVFDKVTWDCRIYKNYSSFNMGCKNRVVTGLNWVFERVDRAIILEDDCIPSESFFYFSSELLERYKLASDVGMICGTNFNSNISIDQSYYFSKFAKIWGWATWKRVWNLYDSQIEDWPILKKANLLDKLSLTSNGKRRWTYGFDQIYKNKIDTWDYQLAYAMFKYELKCIVPSQNLISNIGFGETATHTKNPKNKYSNLQKFDLPHELDHPINRDINNSLDRLEEIRLFELTLFKLLLLKIYGKFEKVTLAKAFRLVYYRLK